MQSVLLSSAIEAPTPPHHAQAARVAGRVKASPSVVALLAFHAFGPTRRGDLATLASVTSARVAACTEARS